MLARSSCNSSKLGPMGGNGVRAGMPGVLPQKGELEMPLKKPANCETCVFCKAGRRVAYRCRCY
jgi:hypothetical protein